MILRYIIVFKLLLVAFAGSALAQEQQQQIRKAAIVSVMIEAAIVSSVLFEDRLDSTLGELFWSGQFSDREWEMQAEGNIADTGITFSINGFLWGQPEEDWSVTYFGQGSLSEEPISVNGRAEWSFNSELGGHQNMDFHQVIKFGDNTWWGWVLGAELFVGGSIGATGGLVAGPAGSLGGAIIVGSAAVGISAGAKSLIESDDPVDPPRMPDRPARPIEGEVMLAGGDRIITVVSPDGFVSGSAFGRLILEGEWKDDDGFFEAYVFQQ